MLNAMIPAIILVLCCGPLYASPDETAELDQPSSRPSSARAAKPQVINVFNLQTHRAFRSPSAFSCETLNGMWLPDGHYSVMRATGEVENFECYGGNVHFKLIRETRESDDRICDGLPSGILRFTSGEYRGCFCMYGAFTCGSGSN